MEKPQRSEKQPASISTETASVADMKTLIGIEESVSKSHVYSPMTGEDEWSEELEKYTVELIKIGEDTVGSIAYTEETPGVVYISGIIVRPEYQGQGVATQAIQQVLAKYPNAERFWLVTHPENPALKLYQSLGFEVTERIENYFGDGQPRLKLVRANTSI